MKRILIGVVTAVLAFAGQAALAKESKIAFVNGVRVLQQYSPQIEQKLGKAFKNRRNDIVSLQNEIKAKAEKYKADEAILSDAQRSKVQSELESKQIEYRRLTKAFEEDFTRQRNKELQVLSQKIEKVINKVAKEQNIDIVLQSQAAVFANKKLDITMDVLKSMKKSKIS